MENKDLRNPKVCIHDDHNQPATTQTSSRWTLTSATFVLVAIAPCVIFLSVHSIIIIMGAISVWTSTVSFLNFTSIARQPPTSNIPLGIDTKASFVKDSVAEGNFTTIITPQISISHTETRKGAEESREEKSHGRKQDDDDSNNPDLHANISTKSARKRRRSPSKSQGARQKLAETGLLDLGSDGQEAVHIQTTKKYKQKNLAAMLVEDSTEHPQDDSDHEENEPTFAIYESSRKWDNGQDIPVYFMNGNLAQHEQVKRGFQVYQELVNLRFRFIDHKEKAKSLVRIRFDAEQGSWSFVGKQQLKYGKDLDDPTMGLDIGSESSRENHMVILHEIGHMVGLRHEHASPGCTIRWNREAVIADHAPYWDEEAIVHNILRRFRPGEVTSTKYDPISIMHYSVQQHHTLNDVHVDRNYELSELDKQTLMSMYPKSPK